MRGAPGGRRAEPVSPRGHDGEKGARGARSCDGRSAPCVSALPQGCLPPREETRTHSQTLDKERGERRGERGDMHSQAGVAVRHLSLCAASVVADGIVLDRRWWTWARARAT